MSRSLVISVVVLVVLIGGLVFLAGHVHDKPLQHVEQAVPLDNLAS